MKYVSPKYEQSALKTNDILTASGEKYEIEQNDNGNGNVIMKAYNLFK